MTSLCDLDLYSVSFDVANVNFLLVPSADINVPLNFLYLRRSCTRRIARDQALHLDVQVRYFSATLHAAFYFSNKFQLIDVYIFSDFYVRQMFE